MKGMAYRHTAAAAAAAAAAENEYNALFGYSARAEIDFRVKCVTKEHCILMK